MWLHINYLLNNCYNSSVNCYICYFHLILLDICNWSARSLEMAAALAEKRKAEEEAAEIEHAKRQKKDIEGDIPQDEINPILKDITQTQENINADVSVFSILCLYRHSLSVTPETIICDSLCLSVCPAIKAYISVTMS